MNRLAKLAVGGLLGVLSASSVDAQQAGQSGQGTQGTKTQPGQGKVQQGAYQGPIGPTPWFQNQDIRQHFKLNDQQYNQLNKGYTQSYAQYQQDMKNLNNNLPADQRAQKMRELQQGFYGNFSKSVDNVFTDPQQRARYNQLHLQYQGYDAFYDPMVQEKLKLTPDQRTKLGQQAQKWNSQMNDFSRAYQNDSEGTSRKFNDMRKQYSEQLNTLLTPEQQKAWQQMIGEPYPFQASTYFQANTGPAKDGKRQIPDPKQP